MTRSLTLTKLQGVCKTLFDKSNKKQARSVDLVALFLTVFMFATWAAAHPERFHLEMMQPGCNGYQDLRDLLRGIDSLYNYIQHLSEIQGSSQLGSPRRVPSSPRPQNHSAHRPIFLPLGSIHFEPQA